MAVEETGGIGMKISQLYNYTTKGDDKRGSIVVLDVFKGSPAQKHGIQKGDIILKVNNETTKNNDFIDLLHDHLRGCPYTQQCRAENKHIWDDKARQRRCWLIA